jgi:hypothetical protein
MVVCHAGAQTDIQQQQQYLLGPRLQLRNLRADVHAILLSNLTDLQHPPRTDETPVQQPTVTDCKRYLI